MSALISTESSTHAGVVVRILSIKMEVDAVILASQVIIGSI